MLQSFARSLGEGRIEKLRDGTKIFILSHFGGNPVVKDEHLGIEGAVFNPGASLFENKVMLLPRVHWGYQKKKVFDEKLGVERWIMENYISQVWVLYSEDGKNFKRYDNVVIKSEEKDFKYGIEDIRIVKFKDFYLLCGCGKLIPPFKGSGGDRVAIYTTRDFKEIKYHGIIKEFDSRNAFPFHREINGKLLMFFRFHPNIHLCVLEEGVEQLLNPEKYSKLYQKIFEEREKSLLIKAGEFPHEHEKVGAGVPVIETEKGFLFIYHAVGEYPEELCEIYGIKERIKRGYSICAALLDPENPQKVIKRTKYPIYIAHKPYELFGGDGFEVDVPCVNFPVGYVQIGDKILLYCGAGDKYVVLLSFSLQKLIDYLWNLS